MSEIHNERRKKRLIDTYERIFDNVLRVGWLIFIIVISINNWPFK
jgi:hypothetical protein